MTPRKAMPRVSRSSDLPRNFSNTRWADDTGGASVTLWLTIGGIVAGVALALWGAV